MNIINKLNHYTIIRKRKKIHVYSVEHTLNKIISEKCSVSRYGDGEFLCALGSGIKFQEKNLELEKRLREILFSSQSNHIVCLPAVFTKKQLENTSIGTMKWWNNHIKTVIPDLLEIIDLKKKYYNSSITRFWFWPKSKELSYKYLKELKKIWQNKDIVIIEGEKTRMGVGNDLFSNSSSCRRMLCPAVNAYDSYPKILSKSKLFSKDVLFLIALGPTAVVLAYDLSIAGYQAIDIGHIDLEYEWMKMGATKKVKIEGKYVNEVKDGDQVSDINDDIYLSEIVMKI